MKKKELAELIELIGEDLDNDLNNEDIVKLLLTHRLSKNETKDKKINKLTFGQKASDKIAAFVGSWSFIISFLILLIVWFIINTVLLVNAFDPYPFILLNLVLSTIAAIQAPLIMMSQKRMDEKDRERNVSDYMVNLKSEIVVGDIHRQVEHLSYLVNKNKKTMEALEKLLDEHKLKISNK